MFTIQKIQKLSSRIGIWLSLPLAAVLIMMPTTALAASETYAVSCVDSDVNVSGNRVSCSKTPAIPIIEGIGSAQQPYPNNTGIILVKVDCGKSSPVNPAVGKQANFKCRKGSPKVTNVKTIQKNGTNPPPVVVHQCSSSGCDLVGTYINPAINLLSVAFGLVAAISLILGGIQFTTSEGDPQKASRAKSRITDTIMAMVAYSLLWGFLQFLIPGGVFNR